MNQVLSNRSAGSRNTTRNRRRLSKGKERSKSSRGSKLYKRRRRRKGKNKKDVK